MARRRRPVYAKIYADLLEHPKTISSAKTLKIPSIYVAAHLVSLWIKALDFAEDGDLWRGDDDASLRLFESLAGIQDDAMRFLEVFRRDKWIDGWLIHDWLDYNSEILIARHSSHNRPFLVLAYQKYNRVYGKGMEEPVHPDGKQGKLLGSDWEVDGKGTGSHGNNSDPPVTQSPKPTTQSPKPTTQSPLALNENKKEAPSPLTPETSEKRSPARGQHVPRATSASLNEGIRAMGYPVMQSELTGDGLTHKEVFEAFLPLLVAHGILTLESFFARVKWSRASPAEWIMLYLDKIHAVYRNREGSTLLDDDADPVGMTMAGLIPSKTRCRHSFTEAARSLFIEIMIDKKKTQKGGRSKWLGRLSGPTVVVELERRKGKASKIA